MSAPKPGKLIKQGPVATLEGDITFKGGDRFLFNGQQFVHFISQAPKVNKASACKVLYITGDGEVYKTEYPSFKNDSGEYRFIDGVPTYTGSYTGWPNSYDHIIIGYDTPITTSTIKFWSVDYIPTSVVRIDYGHTDDHFYTIPTHAGNVTYTFDDSVKVYSTETVSTGMYVYTIDLGQAYTAKYWRIRSFIHSTATTRVNDVNGKDVVLVTASGLPGSSSEFGFGSGTFNANLIDNITNIENSSYGTVTDQGDGTYLVEDLKFSGDNPGTIAIGAQVDVIETVTSVVQSYRFKPEYENYPWKDYITPESNPGFYDSFTTTVTEDITLASVRTTETCTVASSPEYVDVLVDGSLPDYSSNPWIGPNGGTVTVTLTYSIGTAPWSDFTYTSITTNTLNSVDINQYVSTDDLYAGDHFVYSYPLEIAQVDILGAEGPMFKFWETDGSVALPRLLDITGLYDVVFDKGDEVFYGIRFKSTGGSGPSMSDDFSAGDGQYVDTDRWTQYGNSLNRDESTEALIFLNTASGISANGSIISNSYYTGDFSASIPVSVTTLSGEGFYGLAVRDTDHNNQKGGIYVTSDWGESASRSFVAASLASFVNATDGTTTLKNFVFDPYDLPEGGHNHKLAYSTSTSSWSYTRTAVGTSYVSDVSGQSKGVGPSINADGFTLSLNVDSTVPDGGYFSFFTAKTTLSGVTNTDVEIKIVSTDSTNELDFQYKDDASFVSLMAQEVDDSDFKANIIGSTENYANISTSAFESTGSFSWNIPCFEVVAIDNNGDLVEVSGVTNESGVAISSLDLIKKYNKEYGSYYSTVSIGTNGITEASGGSLFIKVGGDLYKFNKTTLPLSALEDGTHTAVLASGVLPSRNVYNFAYDSYSNGGLSYVQSDSSRNGIFMKELKTTTLSRTSYESELDVTAASVPLAWDTEDLDTLYYLYDNDVYVFNTNESDVAFCNLSSSEPILPASSNYQTTITAHVVNLFGEALSNKTVSFSLTDGAGSISPATGCTTSSGTATTTFTPGSSTGVSTITATASNTAC